MAKFKKGDKLVSRRYLTNYYLLIGEVRSTVWGVEYAYKHVDIGTGISDLVFSNMILDPDWVIYTKEIKATNIARTFHKNNIVSEKDGYLTIRV